ncbi:hypothetical protein AB0J72_14410 [Dactylosporangium sp. NPDC049742]|uniref:hypothetical protein n=1 Tax=Dactylosporangium sp. NPDC049742 TaxID=3154737 RepID=UPI00343A34D2
MMWVALRVLRPYLVGAVVVSAVAAGYVWFAAGVVQRQLDRAGVPGCGDPNECYPHGAALDAVLGMEVVAEFVPGLLGLVLGAALLARGGGGDPPAERGRWVLVRSGWVLAAGLICCGAVAAAHRSVATRYTVLADDTYELLQLLHLNNAAYMVAQTLVIAAFAGVVGLGDGRVPRTLVLTALAGPFVVMVGDGVAALLWTLLGALTGWTGSAGGDLFVLDPFAYTAGVVLAAGAVALVLLARRAATGKGGQRGSASPGRLSVRDAPLGGVSKSNVEVAVAPGRTSKALVVRERRTTAPADTLMSVAATWRGARPGLLKRTVMLMWSPVSTSTSVTTVAGAARCGADGPASANVGDTTPATPPIARPAAVARRTALSVPRPSPMTMRVPPEGFDRQRHTTG